MGASVSLFIARDDGASPTTRDGPRAPRRTLPRGARHKDRARERLIGIIAIIVVLGIWEFVVEAHLVGKFLLASPTGIAVSIGHLFRPGVLVTALKISA